MASRAMLLMLLQTALLLMLALSWSIEGVRGEEELQGETLVTPNAPRRSLYVRRQRWDDGYGGYGGYGRWRENSCQRNKELCTRSPYPGGWQCCGDRCAEVQTDYNNCGWCGNRCGWSETCCAGKCVNLSNDPNNCGRCGDVCPKHECKWGVCRYDGRYEFGHDGNEHNGRGGNEGGRWGGPGY